PVTARTHPGIAIDVDPPMRDGLFIAIVRGQPQHLGHAATPRSRPMDDLVLDGDPHQANLNWRPIAPCSWAFSNMKASRYWWSPPAITSPERVLLIRLARSLAIRSASPCCPVRRASCPSTSTVSST